MSDPALRSGGSLDPPTESPADPRPANPPATQPRSKRPSPRVWIAAAILAIAAATLWFLSFFVQPPTSRSTAGGHAKTVRFTLTLPDETKVLDGAQLAVSPDGTQVVVAARDGSGTSHLWLRRLESPDWRELPRTDNATFPFWSPDSRHVGFFAGRSVKRIDVASDLTQTLADVTSGRGGTWSAEGVIVVAGSNGLWRISASGGEPLPLTNLDAQHGQRAHLWPKFLPDGHRYVFLVPGSDEEKDALHMGDVDVAGSTAIEGGRWPVTFVDNVLLSTRGSALTVQGFDPENGLTTDELQTIRGIDDIAGNATAGWAFSASSTVLVYRRRPDERRQLTWFSRNGEHLGVVGEPADYAGFTVSPAQRSIAVARRHNNESGIWLMDVNANRVNRLTQSPQTVASPIWSPDGSRIAFVSRRNGEEGVYTVVADGGGKEDLLFRSSGQTRITDWSRDARWLLYTAWSPKTGMDLWALSMMGEPKPIALEQTAANESQSRLSADGRWIVYVSDQAGQNEVYVRAFPPSESRWQVSTDGGTNPQWRPDGREIYFLSPNDQLMAVDVARTSTAVDVSRSSTLHYGTPRPLMHLRGADDFAVAEGGRFLVPLPIDERGDNTLHVILNWASELRNSN